MRIFLPSILLLATALGLNAQTDVVKEATHMLNTAKPDYAAVLRTVTPALSNEESSEMPESWNTAGRAALGLWDNMFAQLQLGKAVKADDKKSASRNLTDAFNYFMKAMQLDSIPDEKGKVKPRYSKEISNTIAKNIRAFRNAGIYLYELRDLDGAYEAWEIYLTIPGRLRDGKKLLKQYTRDDVGQIFYYQGLASLSTNKNQRALSKFIEARNTGFSNKELYLYGLEAARREANDSLMLDFARLGNTLYGKSDVSFSLLLINDGLKRKDYEECRRLVNEALAVEGTDDKVKSQLYDVRGVVDEEEGSTEQALDNYQKAVVYDENNAKAYFDMARVIYNEALRQAECGEPDCDKKAEPGLKKSAEYFEKAYDLDSSLSQIPATLYSIYYRLGVGYEGQAAYWQKKQKG